MWILKREWPLVINNGINCAQLEFCMLEATRPGIRITEEFSRRSKNSVCKSNYWFSSCVLEVTRIHEHEWETSVVNLSVVEAARTLQPEKETTVANLGILEVTRTQIQNAKHSVQLKVLKVTGTLPQCGTGISVINLCFWSYNISSTNKASSREQLDQYWSCNNSSTRDDNTVVTAKWRLF